MFYPHLRRTLLSGPDFIGFYQSANRLGRGDFLADGKAVAELLKKHAKKRVWDSIFTSRIVTPGPSFITMLRLLRHVMEILAKAPVLVDTGQYQPKYQQRTYADMTNQLANDLSALPNFYARVKFLSPGEQVLKTKPLPPPVSGDALDARIRQIKREMWANGYTRWYKDVEKEIRERQDLLRGDAASDEPPPTHD